MALRLLSILLSLVLLCPSPALAALASVGTLVGTANGNGTSSTTFAFSPTAQLDAGNIGVVVIFSDNLGTGDGDNSDVTSIDDTVSNTYTKRGEFTNGQGTAATGATVSVWTTKATTNVAITDTVTVHFASAVVDKCVAFWEFTTGQDVQVSGTNVTLAEDGSTDFGSMTLSGRASKEYLWLRASADEANDNSTFTNTANFTPTTFRCRSRNNSLAMSGHAEFRINTSTGETSDPTLAVTADKASIFISLEEQTGGGASSCNGYLGMMGVGC